MTIARNLAFNGRGGGIYLSWIPFSYHAEVNNCILWGDKAGDNSEEIFLKDNASVTVTYSDVKKGWSGTGNIKADPLFKNPRAASAAPTSAGNYHIGKRSPCRNAGTGAFAPDDDIDGDSRLLDGKHDMGSDEFSTYVAGNLLANFSFEEGDTRPYFWTDKNLKARDKRTDDKAVNQDYSFKIAGSRANKSLCQELPIPGQAGDIITLSGWSKASDPSRSGGPYRVEMKVNFTGYPAEKFSKGFTKKTHAWQRKGLSVTVPWDYDSVKVCVRYSRQTGRVWFDAVGLVVE